MFLLAWISILKCSNTIKTPLSVNASYILRSQPTTFLGIRQWSVFVMTEQQAHKSRWDCDDWAANRYVRVGLWWLSSKQIRQGGTVMTEQQADTSGWDCDDWAASRYVRVGLWWLSSKQICHGGTVMTAASRYVTVGLWRLRSEHLQQWETVMTEEHAVTSREWRHGDRALGSASPDISVQFGWKEGQNRF